MHATGAGGRKQAVIAFVVLIVGIAAVVIAGLLRVPKDDSPSVPAGEQAPAAGAAVSGLPVPIDGANVGGVFAHYFFTGAVKEVRRTAEGSVLVLYVTNDKIPEFPLAADTRIARISQPYSAETSRMVSVAELKAGLVVDVSAEYDLRSGQWFTRDVFIPTDRNQ